MRINPIDRLHMNSEPARFNREFVQRSLSLMRVIESTAVRFFVAFGVVQLDRWGGYGCSTWLWTCGNAAAAAFES